MDNNQIPVALSREEFLAFEKAGIKQYDQYDKKYGIEIYTPDNNGGKVIMETQGQYLLCPSIDFILQAFSAYEDSFRQKGDSQEVAEGKPYYSMLEKEKSFTVTDSLGIKHEIPNLSALEFKEYQKKGLREHKEYYDQYGMNVYETEEGKIIVEANMLYCIYPSFDLFYHLLKNPGRPSAVPGLYNKNPYKDDFPNHVDSLIASLLNDLGVSPDNRKEEEVLADVDKVINEKRTVAFFEQHYLSFIALVGHYILKQHKGHWEMILADDNETWTPYLVINDHNKIFFLDYIEEDVYNLNQEKPLTEVFETIKDMIRIDMN